VVDLALILLAEAEPVLEVLELHFQEELKYF
jgi:hypothetical protein